MLQRILGYIDRNRGHFRYFCGRNKIGSLSEYENTKNIYYLMAPSFGNIGDEAIVEASLLFLRDNYPDYQLISIDYDETLQYLKEIRRIIKKEDRIYLQGGGNIGTLYYDAEIVREYIIRKFHDIKIVSMPQSMCFSNDSKGSRRLKRCQRIYRKHPDLTLIAREKFSFAEMKNAFPDNKVILNPDIVFYYSKILHDKPNGFRESVFTCLRSDKEDRLMNVKTQLVNSIGDKYEGFVLSDTCVPRRTPEPVRQKEVLSLFNLFYRTKLVVTDRLHGMVIAALTSTPCLAFPSLDNKVLGTYQWIQDIEYIRFLDRTDDIDFIQHVMDDMLNQSYRPFDWSSFREKYFSTLKNRIEGDCNE